MIHITNGFTYVAFLVAFASSIVWFAKRSQAKFFEYVPPVVLIYLLSMVFCTLQFWDLDATKPAYNALKNNILYAMIFLMLLKCDIRKIIKLGPKMLIGFFAASVSIGIAFILAYAIMKGQLGTDSWKSLAALCGSWMGGSGNMLAVQAALNIGEGDMGYALVIDSIDYSIWVMFLLWAINFAPQFNKWVKADTTALDEVCARLEEEEEEEEHSPITFASLFFLLGVSLLLSAVGQNIGAFLNSFMPLFDKATWTILFITVCGLVLAVTPFSNIAGSAELSSVFLYTIIALLASRANLAELSDAPIWILTGFLILGIHAVILTVFARIFRLDLFTCSVASLANIGGTASAPVLASAYNPALVSVGVLMALIGYVIGTFGALIVAQIMQMIS